jgi:formylglycine-generating enzyme required for sulfatase activity
MQTPCVGPFQYSNTPVIWYNEGMVVYINESALRHGITGEDIHRALETVVFDGLLTVAAEETKSSLEIEAVSTADTARSGTATVTVEGTAAGASKTLTLSGVSVPMRYVPADSFQSFAWEMSYISVITKGYWLAKTETTQKLFQEVMGSNPSYFNTGAADGETQEKRPVEKVRWYHAIAFCNKLSVTNGKQAVYSVNGISGWENLTYAQIPITDNSDWNAAAMDTGKNGYRLPTQIEWMWAAIGADKTIQPNTSGRGKAFAESNGTNSIGDYAWYNSNSGGKTHEVGKKNPNELGLKDMSGMWMSGAGTGAVESRPMSRPTIQDPIRGRTAGHSAPRRAAKPQVARSFFVAAATHILGATIVGSGLPAPPNSSAPSRGVADQR